MKMKKGRHIIICIILTICSLLAIAVISLQFKTGVSMASGDNNLSDDARKIIEKLNNGSTSVHIPDGTYDFKGATVILSKNTQLKGDGSEKSIIKNLCIVAPYGIEIDDVGFIGGAKTTVRMAGSSTMTCNVIIMAQPVTEKSRFVYKNCSFSGVDFASFICDTSKISLDSAENCSFSNIVRAAIYHSVNSASSKYRNNSFQHIGDSRVASGCISGIWIGDVTNNTYTQSDNLIIENNTFLDMITAEDASASKHSINANFISARAIKGDISGNTIKNVQGFGEDREALYTKVKNLTIKNNIIENGGYGEGYITCKGQDGIDAFALIQDNVIRGTYGSGIYLYGPGTIKNNTITITKSKSAIVCHNRTGETNKKVTIEGNNIECDASYYYLNGQMATNYKPSAVISAELEQNDIFIYKNRIVSNSPSSPWNKAINLGGIKNNITIDGNNISIASDSCDGIFIHSSESYSTANRDISIKITNNSITTSDNAIKVQFQNGRGVNSNRVYSIYGNELSCFKPNANALAVIGGDNNEDSVLLDESQVKKGKVTTDVSNIKNK